MDDQETTIAIAGALDGWSALLGRQFGPLSRPQRRMLTLLAEHPETRIGDLTARLGQTTAGTTRMIDALEGLGYARRLRLPDTDGRQVHVALTEAGAAALLEADRAFQARVATTLAPLRPAERAALARLLRAVAATPTAAHASAGEE